MKILFNEFLANEADTLAMGEKCATWLNYPCIVYLDGHLGAGKTTFVRGLLHGLGHTGTVKSPTYAIVESYHLAKIDVQHFDLYRLTYPEEWQDAGLDDLIPHHLCLIEWANQGGDNVPPADYVITLQMENIGRRIIITQTYRSKVSSWQKI